MIRATAATWLNYATTLVFQILFAAQFGTTRQGSAYVIAFAAAVSLAGIFVTTTLTVSVPRMIDAAGRIHQSAARFVLIICALVLVTTTTTALGSSLLAHVVAPLLGESQAEMMGLLLFAAAFLGLEGVAGILGSIALSRGRRFVPALAPAMPSTIGALYLALALRPSVVAVFGAVSVGAGLQLALILVAMFRPRLQVAEGPKVRLGLLTLVTALQLILISLIPLIQRLVSAFGSSSGPVRFDYSFRGVMAAQQLLIGGLLIAILPDWSAVHRQSGDLARSVVRAVVIGGLLLATAAAIGFVAAPGIVRIIFQRGAFTADDSKSVAALVRILLPGFFAEGIYLILAQGLFATARNDLALRLGYFRFGVQVLMTVFFGIALGVAGVAIGYTITFALVLLYALFLSSALGLLRGGTSLLTRAAVAWLGIGVGGIVATVVGDVLPLWLESLAVLTAALALALLFGLGDALTHSQAPSDSGLAG